MCHGRRVPGHCLLRVLPPEPEAPGQDAVRSHVVSSQGSRRKRTLQPLQHQLQHVGLKEAPIPCCRAKLSASCCKNVKTRPGAALNLRKTSCRMNHALLSMGNSCSRFTRNKFLAWPEVEDATPNDLCAGHRPASCSTTPHDVSDLTA